ncbi:hypothetical protein [Streptomyces sp. NPDC015125]|uniref:hypothetical protein n=1 Tax=Streptomyces sp. NPDC015125 TaxID=3364938 RepID=UPI0036F562DB
MTDQPTPPPCTREAIVEVLTRMGRPLKRYDLIVQLYRHNDGTMLDRIYDLPSGAAAPHLHLIDQMVKDGELIYLSGPKWRCLLGPDATPSSVHPGNYYLATTAQHEEWRKPWFTVTGLRMDVDPDNTQVASVQLGAVPDSAWHNSERHSDDGWIRMAAVVRAWTPDEAEDMACAQWRAQFEDESEQWLERP